MTICLALIIGFSLLWAMRSCDPFDDLTRHDKFILKGTVAR